MFPTTGAVSCRSAPCGPSHNFADHAAVRCAWRRCRRAPLAVSAAAAEPAAAAGPAATGHQPLLALKEWAPTCAAIAAGEQTILLRKGGIKEPTFTPAAREFLLFPTSFHTDAELLKPAAAQRYAGEVRYDPKAQRQLAFGTHAVLTGAWTTFDPAVLDLLDKLHVWGPGFLEHRLKWRKQQPLTILELRATRLAAPLVLPPQESYFGCFSWVDLGAGLEEGSPQAAAVRELQQRQAAAAGAAAALGEPSLGDAAFAAKQRLCRQQLERLGDLTELAF